MPLRRRLGTGTAATPYSGDWQGVVTRVRTTSTRVNYNGTRQTQPTSQTHYTHTWWDSALQARIAYDADVGDGTAAKTSTFAYDVNGRVSYVSIDDGRPRTVTFVTDSQGQVLTRREADRITATGDPFSQYVYFNGQRIGEITNDATFTQRSYAAAVISRTAPPSTTTSKPFQNGVSNNPIHGASFDYGYDALRPDSVPASGQAWTVRDGDTLQAIAAAVWGDASLWYLIAEHNGLTGSSLLTAGQLLTVPARVANLHNTSETFRPYDPNKALGDLNPTQPAPPKKPGGCGVVGQIIAVAIAYVVGKFLGPVVGNAASQLFLMATGAQDKFDWKQLAIADISAGVSQALNAFATAANPVVNAVATNVITQGVAVATGLQDRFSWTSVATSAVSAGVNARFGTKIYEAAGGGRMGDFAVFSAMAGSAAATRSLLTGTSFGDNLIASCRM